MSTQLAHRMHRPQPELLHDVGFDLLPELGLEGAWISETIFWVMFIPFVLWSFSPFVTARKRFYTAVLYARLLMVLTACQSLRILSFTVTQLPAPNYHCHMGEPTAVRPMPTHWWGHIVVDLGRQATHGCGDLIFSSHTTFVMVGVLTFTEYGSTLFLKILAWIGMAMLSMCIVASHKHYSVDVVVAWYTVPLVFYTMLRRWTTVRSAHEVWPHRPLVGNEGEDGMDHDQTAENSNGWKDGEAKPLLPVISQSKSSNRLTDPKSLGHSRNGSKSEKEPPAKEEVLGGAARKPHGRTRSMAVLPQESAAERGEVEMTRVPSSSSPSSSPQLNNCTIM